MRVERGVVRVEDAEGQPPTIPFWLGEAPGRSDELSDAVSRLRAEIEARLDPHPNPPPPAGEGWGGGGERAINWLTDEVGIGEPAARQLVDYLAAAHAALGVLPTLETLVFERFFDAVGGMQL